MINKKKQETDAKEVKEEMDLCCPIINEMGKTVAAYFEMAAEVTFENDDDDRIIDLLTRLYVGERYCEAVKLLRVVFGLIEYSEAEMILSFITEKNGPDTEEMFIKAFMRNSLRCEVSSIRKIREEQFQEEE